MEEQNHKTSSGLPQTLPESLRILVVEDEVAVIEMLEGALSRAGYAVSVARDGQQALHLFRQAPFDLVLLDVMMPRMDGWATLRQLRALSSVPVIMLTGRDADSDQVRGLETGADDYITKPTSVAVIRARVRAALRRGKQPPLPEEPVLTFEHGALVIDQQKGTVAIHGQLVDLTPTEYRLLRYLASNPGQVLPHREVLASVWGPGYYEPEVLKLFVSRLRNKIEPGALKGRFIKTRRGRGYFFEA